MTPIQTYGRRSGGSDPYDAPVERVGQYRFGRRVIGHFIADLETPGVVSSAVNTTGGLSRGGLSAITIVISRSQFEHLQGLAEMLRSLELARANADPYVEIDEAIRALIGNSIEQRLAKVLRTVAPHHSKKKPSLEEFLEPALQLEKRGRVDSALDALYDRVDDLLKTGEFEVLDEMLRVAKVESLSTDMLLGLLTATLPARSKLPARVKFFGAAGAAIRTRGEWEDGLLAGLES